MRVASMRMADARGGEARTKTTLEQLVAPASASTSRVAMLIVDDDRRLLEANPAACSLLDSTRRALIGRPLDALVIPAMRQRLDSVWQAFRARRGHAGPFQLMAGQKEGANVDIGVATNVLPGRHLVVLAGSAEQLAIAGSRLESREGEARPPTVREREVLTLLAGGATDGQIAHKLALSPATVQTHVRNAKAKLGARTRAQAVALALRRGMISVSI
jgi:PAS domain S-box-containing protein